VRGVRELAELAADEEGRLLPDVDRVIADPLEAAGDEEHAQAPGTRPAGAVHAEVVASMQGAGVDLEGKTPRALESADADWADLVVTMGCGDECPVLPGKRYVDWALDDPAGRPPEKVDAIRDQIAARVDALLQEL
jgi:arsenate reductase (thioredoxin)